MDEQTRDLLRNKIKEIHDSNDYTSDEYKYGIDILCSAFSHLSGFQKLNPEPPPSSVSEYWGELEHRDCMTYSEYQ